MALDLLDAPRSMFRPQRALLHPAFVVALAVLALNDHVLKGAGMLPAWLTGKASDFAGLLVAQAVLAVLVCVRSRRGLALSSLFLGSGFAAIKTSAAASALYEHVLSFVGAKNVVDETDLVALVVLPFGFCVFARAMESSTTESIIRRRIEKLALLTALPFCIATSAPDTVCVDGSVRFGSGCVPAFDAWTFVYNAGAKEIDVTVRVMSAPPASPLELDDRLCHPEPDDFQPPRTIHLRRGEAAAVDAEGSSNGPRVALVSAGDDYPTAVFVVTDGATARQRVPVSGWSAVDDEHVPATGPHGGIGIDREDEDGRVYRAFGSRVYPFGCALDSPDAGGLEDVPSALEVDAGTDDAGVDP